jgi:Mn-dependent DtxR family transcriptional regulator
MVQRLDAEGLLKYEKYRGLALTTAGEALALNITRRHQLLTDFLKLLGLDDEVIYHDVEGMEHHISPPTLARHPGAHGTASTATRPPRQGSQANG